MNVLIHGNAVEKPDSYARRLIEQGKAVPAPNDGDREMNAPAPEAKKAKAKRDSAEA